MKRTRALLLLVLGVGALAASALPFAVLVDAAARARPTLELPVTGGEHRVPSTHTVVCAIAGIVASASRAAVRMDGFFKRQGYMEGGNHGQPPKT